MRPKECVEPSTLQALAEDRVSDEERAALSLHADSCADCRTLLAEVDSPLRVSPALVMTETAPPEARVASDDLQLLRRGDRIGRYEVETLLGAGGIGVVYRAFDPELGRSVALKLLKADPVRHGAAEQVRLMREAQAMAKIAHPNVVTVYDAGTFRDRVYIAMELVSGSDLMAWLAARPRRIAEIVDVFRTAGAGLAAAHAAGLVHRDFKPSNVLVGEDGRARVTDFGLARAMDAVDAVAESRDLGGEGGQGLLQGTLTRTGAIMGTPAYMAPEQHVGGNTDARTDEFAFCASLYEALYGERAFGGDSYHELRHEVTAGRVREPPRRSKVPASLRRILLRGLAVRPGNRWPTMESLLEVLGRDRTKVARRVVVAAGALLLAIATAGIADAILRDRLRAEARAAFAGARASVVQALTLRWETFSAIAKLTMIVPVMREVSATRDESDFGLGSVADDTKRIEALHSTLRAADWQLWGASTRRGHVAVADYKGRLLFSTANRNAFGQDMKVLEPVAHAYRDAIRRTGAGVLSARDPRLLQSGLFASATGQGLVIVFARALVLGDVPYAVFLQVLKSGAVLRDLVASPDLRLSLVSADGSSDGALPAALVAAVRDAGEGLVEVTGDDGVPWLVQRYAVPGLEDSAGAIATLIMARSADVGLAGLFPHARLVLLAQGALLALVVGIALWRARAAH